MKENREVCYCEIAIQFTSLQVSVSNSYSFKMILLSKQKLDSSFLFLPLCISNTRSKNASNLLLPYFCLTFALLCLTFLHASSFYFTLTIDVDSYTLRHLHHQYCILLKSSVSHYVSERGFYYSIIKYEIEVMLVSEQPSHILIHILFFTLSFDLFFCFVSCCWEMLMIWQFTNDFQQTKCVLLLLWWWWWWCWQWR